MAGVVEAIFAVFTSIAGWIVETIPSLYPIFWNATDNTLTFMGTLAVVALGVNVILLFIGIIQRFIKFKA